MTIHLVSIHVDKFHVNILKNRLCGKKSPFSPLSNGIFTIKIGWKIKKLLQVEVEKVKTEKKGFKENEVFFFSITNKKNRI